MQKHLGLIILGLVILLASGADSRDNLSQAGKAALASRETVLAEMAQNISVKIQEMAADGVITTQEMKEWKRAVEKFYKQKEEADQYLKIYGLLTVTKLDPKIQKLIQIYEKPFLWKGFWGKDEMRLILADITAIDVSRIEESFSWITLGAFLIILLFGIALFLVGLTIITKEHQRWGFLTLGSILFFCSFALLVLALDGVI